MVSVLTVSLRDVCARVKSTADIPWTTWDAVSLKDNLTKIHLAGKHRSWRYPGSKRTSHLRSYLDYYSPIPDRYHCYRGTDQNLKKWSKWFRTKKNVERGNMPKMLFFFGVRGKQPDTRTCVLRISLRVGGMVWHSMPLSMLIGSQFNKIRKSVV